MRKFGVLFKKELKELVTLHVIAPMVVTVVVLNVVGKIVSVERTRASKTQSVAVMDLDGTTASGFALEALSSSGFAITKVEAQPVPQALAAAERARWNALVVIPEGFGQGLEDLKPQKLEVYAILHSLSLASSLKTLDVPRAAAAVNERMSTRLIAAGVKDVPPEFLRRPVSSADGVWLRGRLAKVPIGHVIGFIQSQTALIPVVMLMVIMMSAQMVATAIVNEKENKTLETLLSLPVDRNSIILAKLSAAAFVAFLFAGVFLLAFRFYMTDVVGDMAAAAGARPTLEALAQLGLTLGPSGYLLLWTSLFFGILCALAIAMILGLLAEDVKGAQIAVMPILVLVMIPYLLTVMMDVETASPAVRWLVQAIPFSHPFLASSNILTGRLWPVVAGAAYEAVVFLFFVTLATKLFASEALFTAKLWPRRREKAQ